MIKTVDEQDYSGLNESVKNVNGPKGAIFLVKKCEDHLKREKRKIINIVEKQGELQKKFKESDGSFSHIASAELIFILRRVYISLRINFRE